MTASHTTEIEAGERFGFGENWARFLAVVDEERIAQAENSLRTMLGRESLLGLRFLDIGSGSGLFSLAARRLGARVHSFDFDPASVGCTAELRRRFRPDDDEWLVQQGSVLDEAFMNSLGQFDVVYSWGVLHHTGAMWRAIANAAGRVKTGGSFFIAIYNDQGRASRIWLRVKQAYNRLPASLRWLVLVPSALWLWGPTTLRDLLRGRPFETWREYSRLDTRGMSPWRNLVDWVGGLPFEVAKPDAVFGVVRDMGFELRELRTCAGGLGCNEFVFRRAADGK